MSDALGDKDTSSWHCFHIVGLLHFLSAKLGYEGPGIVTLSGVGRKSSNPSFLHAAVAALSHTPNASARRFLNRVRFSPS